PDARRRLVIRESRTADRDARGRWQRRHIRWADLSRRGRARCDGPALRRGPGREAADGAGPDGRRRGWELERDPRAAAARHRSRHGAGHRGRRPRLAPRARHAQAAARESARRTPTAIGLLRVRSWYNHPEEFRPPAAGARPFQPREPTPWDASASNSRW